MNVFTKYINCNLNHHFMFVYEMIYKYQQRRILKEMVLFFLGFWKNLWCALPIVAMNVKNLQFEIWELVTKYFLYAISLSTHRYKPCVGNENITVQNPYSSEPWGSHGET